ncbi:uncharacterized protein [Drosophila kikkawai]|uniref:Uncharacterized protein n=1 Tax=Drosophila kikkawai TaxID=30033 RepID=A0A6P4IC74_DROKI|nr:uncharacterized protein LOC108073374 [Drosophila kikkawai]
MVNFGALPQKRSGRVLPPKRTPVSASKSNAGPATLSAASRLMRRRPAIGSSASAKRTTAGALTNLSGRLAGSPSLGMFHSQSLLADPKAQTTALRQPPVPPPRPLRRATGLSALQVASTAPVGLAAKVSGAGPALAAHPIAPSIPIQTTLAPKKSSLSKRALSGGKGVDPCNQTKRRVKFSSHVSAQPTDTTITAKKSARIGELQLKKRVKTLKRIRSRREGGHGGSGITPDTSGILATSNQDINTIIDVEALKAPPPPPPPAPRILRLNVVGKSSPATGKSALAAALQRKAKRTRPSAAVELDKATTAGVVRTAGKVGSGSRIRKSVKTTTKVITSKAGGGSKQKLLGASSHSVTGSSAGLATHKKTLSAATAGLKRRKPQPANGRRGYGKA